MLNELSQIKDITVDKKIGKCRYFIEKNAKGKNVFSPVLHLNVVHITNEHDATFISKKEKQQLVCEKILSAIEKIRNS